MDQLSLPGGRTARDRLSSELDGSSVAREAGSAPTRPVCRSFARRKRRPASRQGTEGDLVGGASPAEATTASATCADHLPRTSAGPSLSQVGHAGKVGTKSKQPRD